MKNINMLYKKKEEKKPSVFPTTIITILQILHGTKCFTLACLCIFAFI